MVSGPPGDFCFGAIVVRVWWHGAPLNELHQRGSGGARGQSPRKILSKFGGLEAILAIRNIQIVMKLKVTKSNNIMNKCYNEQMSCHNLYY